MVALALLVMADRPRDAEPLIDRLLRARTDHPGAHLFSAQILGESLWRLGRSDEAIDALRSIKAYYDDRGETGINSTTTAQLARYLAGTGHFDEAAALVEQARSMAAPDDFATSIEIDRATAILAVARGDPEGALAATSAQIDTLRPTDSMMNMADALRARGEILLDLGRREEADESLDEALALYDRKGAVASARRLRTWRSERDPG